VILQVQLISSVHPSDCPNWEYADHPKREVILKERTIDVLVQLQGQTIDSLESAADTRLIHGYLFCLLVPREHLYFAGHYRGEDFRCLKSYPVGIERERDIGLHPSRVVETMEQIALRIRQGIKALDTTHLLPDSQMSPEDKLLNTVVFACRVFDAFLRVHPYANGNGHAARFIVWAILGRYGYWPTQFTIEPRPNYPLYGWVINQYRKGNRQLLENYILRCIVGD
jgi:fido (protein-threonine AMPylation protein)